MQQNARRAKLDGAKLDELTKKSHNPVMTDDEIERGNIALITVVCFLIGILVVATAYGRIMT